MIINQLLNRLVKKKLLIIYYGTLLSRGSYKNYTKRHRTLKKMDIFEILFIKAILDIYENIKIWDLYMPAKETKMDIRTEQVSCLDILYVLNYSVRNGS